MNENNTIKLPEYTPADIQQIRDVIDYACGNNPEKKAYYPNDFNSITELVSYMMTEPHKSYLSQKNISMEEKMSYMFGEEWDEANHGTHLSTPEDNHYEMVDHPTHYNSSSIETIEKMRRIWGDDATALWCEMTAFKYRDRIGNKPDNPIEQEVGKIQWYEKKAKELRNICS